MIALVISEPRKNPDAFEVFVDPEVEVIVLWQFELMEFETDVQVDEFLFPTIGTTKVDELALLVVVDVVLVVTTVVSGL